MNAAAYEDAAALFSAVITNHAFRDGNKRTAVVILRSFLNLNAHDHSLTEDDLFGLALGVAESKLDIDSVELRLRESVIAL